MPHFVYDSETLTDKGNQTALPSGADATKYVQASDWNDLNQDLRDLREAVSGYLTRKRVVRIATTANDTLSGLAARDGVTPVAGDRVLAKNQTTASQNGVYVAASGAWARAGDFDSTPEVVSGAVVEVGPEGTANARTQWMLTTTGTVVVGTTSLTFEQLGSARALGEVSQQGNVAATTVTDTTSYFLVNLSAPALSGLESQFDNPSGHRLRYTGAATKTFLVNCILGAFVTAGALPTLLLFRLAKNGTTVARSEQPLVTRTFSVSDHGSIQFLVSLAQNDYVELYVRNATAIANVTVAYFNVATAE